MDVRGLFPTAEPYLVDWHVDCIMLYVCRFHPQHLSAVQNNRSTCFQDQAWEEYSADMLQNKGDSILQEDML